MNRLYVVSLLLSQFAVGAPLVLPDRIPNTGTLHPQSPPILGIETFESYYIDHPNQWMFPVNLPWMIEGGMGLVGNARGDAGVFDYDNMDLGDNSTPGGKQHFRSSGGGLRSSIMIYFPHKVQAFGFYYSGYDGYEPSWPDAPWNTLTAYYQGGHTRFGPSQSGGFSIESLVGFDYVSIEEVCVHPERRCETTWGLDDIWYAGDLGPVTVPEPGTLVLVASSICALSLLNRRAR